MHGNMHVMLLSMRCNMAECGGQNMHGCSRKLEQWHDTPCQHEPFLHVPLPGAVRAWRCQQPGCCQHRLGTISFSRLSSSWSWSMLLCRFKPPCTATPCSCSASVGSGWLWKLSPALPLLWLLYKLCAHPASTAELLLLLLLALPARSGLLWLLNPGKSGLRLPSTVVRVMLSMVESRLALKRQGGALATRRRWWCIACAAGCGLGGCAAW